MSTDKELVALLRDVIVSRIEDASPRSTTVHFKITIPTAQMMANALSRISAAAHKAESAPSGEGVAALVEREAAEREALVANAVERCIAIADEEAADAVDRWIKSDIDATFDASAANGARLTADRIASRIRKEVLAAPPSRGETAGEDTARLDWLEAEGQKRQMWVGHAILREGSLAFEREGRNRWKVGGQGIGDAGIAGTLREAIDAARQSESAGEKP